eukprot:1159770-Pelagomonas_calceolata.AAC.8
MLNTSGCACEMMQEWKMGGWVDERRWSEHEKVEGEREQSGRMRGCKALVCRMLRTSGCVREGA